MLKQKYFLTGIFILSAERQPIKLAWRKIVWLPKVQAFKAYLRAYVRKHLDSQDTVLFVESRMNEERTLTAMLQTNLTSEEE